MSASLNMTTTVIRREETDTHRERPGEDWSDASISQAMLRSAGTTRSWKRKDPLRHVSEG